MPRVKRSTLADPTPKNRRDVGQAKNPHLERGCTRQIRRPFPQALEPALLRPKSSDALLFQRRGHALPDPERPIVGNAAAAAAATAAATAAVAIVIEDASTRTIARSRLSFDDNENIVRRRQKTTVRVSRRSVDVSTATPARRANGKRARRVDGSDQGGEREGRSRGGDERLAKEFSTLGFAFEARYARQGRRQHRMHDQDLRGPRSRQSSRSRRAHCADGRLETR